MNAAAALLYVLQIGHWTLSIRLGKNLIRKDDAAEKAEQEALKAKTEAAIEAVESEHK